MEKRTKTPFGRFSERGRKTSEEGWKSPESRWNDFGNKGGFNTAL